MPRRETAGEGGGAGSGDDIEEGGMRERWWCDVFERLAQTRRWSRQGEEQRSTSEVGTRLWNTERRHVGVLQGYLSRLSRSSRADHDLRAARPVALACWDLDRFVGRGASTWCSASSPA